MRGRDFSGVRPQQRRDVATRQHHNVAAEGALISNLAPRRPSIPSILSGPESKRASTEPLEHPKAPLTRLMEKQEWRVTSAAANRHAAVVNTCHRRHTVVLQSLLSTQQLRVTQQRETLPYFISFHSRLRWSSLTRLIVQKNPL